MSLFFALVFLFEQSFHMPPSRVGTHFSFFGAHFSFFALNSNALISDPVYALISLSLSLSLSLSPSLSLISLSLRSIQKHLFQI